MNAAIEAAISARHFAVIVHVGEFPCNDVYRIMEKPNFITQIGGDFECSDAANEVCEWMNTSAAIIAFLRNCEVSEGVMAKGREELALHTNDCDIDLNDVFVEMLGQLATELEGKYMELRDKVDRAIAGPVLHGFDGWRLDKPVIWDQVPDADRELLRKITETAIATVQEAGWQDISTIPDAMEVVVWMQGVDCAGQAMLATLYDRDAPMSFVDQYGDWYAPYQNGEYPTLWMLPPPQFEGTNTNG